MAVHLPKTARYIVDSEEVYSMTFASIAVIKVFCIFKVHSPTHADACWRNPSISRNRVEECCVCVALCRSRLARTVQCINSQSGVNSAYFNAIMIPFLSREKSKGNPRQKISKQNTSRKGEYPRKHHLLDGSNSNIFSLLRKAHRYNCHCLNMGSAYRKPQ